MSSVGLAEGSAADVPGWKEVHLADILLAMKNGTTAQQISGHTDFPVTRIETISSGYIDRSRVGYLQQPEPSYLLQTGDILYSHINSVSHIGKSAIYRGGEVLYHGMNLMLLRPNAKVVSPDYLARVLEMPQNRAFAARECKPAINQASLGQRQIGSLRLALPPVPEQRTITKILDAADEAIRSTERLIAKLEQAKRGLLHDLLTYGIDESGHLRDPWHQPDLFVHTPLGLLPRAWDISDIGNVADVLNGSTPSRLRRDYWDDGRVAWLASGKVNDDEINSPSELITDRAVKECSLRLLPAGSVVVGMIGEGKTRGMAARLGITATINQNLAGIVPGPRIDGKFLHLFLSYNYDTLRRGGRGSNQDALNTQLVSRFQIAVPSLQEQRYIESRMGSLAERSNVERQELG